jgi:hypothetical protein
VETSLRFGTHAGGQRVDEHIDWAVGGLLMMAGGLLCSSFFETFFFFLVLADWT